MLTFEKAEFLGGSAIVEKLTVIIHFFLDLPSVLIIPQSLPFTKVRHNVSTIDAQPSKFSGAIIVSVTGLLLVCWLIHTYTPSYAKQVDDESNPLSFSQVFQLVPDGGSYYVYVSWSDYWRVPR